MRIRNSITALGALALLAGCEAPAADVTLETDGQKASYFIGFDLGSSLEPIADDFDFDAFRKGLDGGLAGLENELSQEEIQTVMTAFSQKVQQAQAEEMQRVADENRVEGEAYMAENASKEGVMTTDSGLQYEILREGDGAQPSATDQVQIHYRGTLIDGTQFDSSYDRGSPATFAVSGVIPGFSEGLRMMTVGSQYRFVIPGNLGYGAQGSPPSIGPNETLIFEVELLDIPDEG